MTSRQQLNQMNDAQLIQEFWNHNEFAFSVIVAHNKEGLRNYLHHLMHNNHDEKDVQQITWMLALESLRSHAYRESGRFTQWLYTIARNEANRKMKTEHALKYETDENMPEEEDLSGEENAMNDEAAIKVTDVIVSLNEPSRSIVWLRIAGKTFEEIGVTVHLKANVVRSLYSRARKYIRKIVKAPFMRR